MKRIVIFLLLCCSFPALGYPLKLTVTTDRQYYILGDTIFVTIAVQNLSNQPYILQFSQEVPDNFCIDTLGCENDHNFYVEHFWNYTLAADTTIKMTRHWSGPPPGYGLHTVLGYLDGLSGSYGSDSTWFFVDTLAQVTYTQVTYNLVRGWNLLSVPPHTPADSILPLLASAITPPYIFRGGYQTVSELPSGSGFWLKCDSARSVSLHSPARDIDTIDVVPGWNLISALSVTVPMDSMKSSPPGIILSHFITLPLCDWTLCPNLSPGIGYWVKIKQAGTLILKGN